VPSAKSCLLQGRNKPRRRSHPEEDEYVTIVPISHDDYLRGFALYRSRLDKDWSLTDCISFLVMEDHGLQEALTVDHHFEQAGFNVLLKG
jgi:uncharacterized protein